MESPPRGTNLKTGKEAKLALKAEVDMTEINNALKKVSELCEALEKANSLLQELASNKSISISIEMKC